MMNRKVKHNLTRKASGKIRLATMLKTYMVSYLYHAPC